jgi:hypothetical protein
MSIRRNLIAASAALCLATPLLSGAVADAGPARQGRDYPQLGPSGAWAWYPAEHYIGGFKLKVPKAKGKLPTLSKITFTAGDLAQSGCPTTGVEIKVLGKVTLKPAPKREDILGFSPWDTGGGGKSRASAGGGDPYFQGVKPVPVKISVAGAAPLDGQVAFEFVKPQENKKYYGVVGVIHFGGCYEQPSFSYPAK